MNMTYCDETQEIVLEKNPTYWDAANVATDKIVIKLVDDSNTTLALLETGEVDVIDTFPSEEVERLQAAGMYHSTSKLATNFLLLNCQNTEGNVLADARVRKALSLAFAAGAAGGGGKMVRFPLIAEEITEHLLPESCLLAALKFF